MAWKPRVQFAKWKRPKESTFALSDSQETRPTKTSVAAWKPEWMHLSLSRFEWTSCMQRLNLLTMQRSRLATRNLRGTPKWLRLGRGPERLTNPPPRISTAQQEEVKSSSVPLSRRFCKTPRRLFH